ncbi:MAG TPA: 3-hydroxyacyl-ACP dehydratase FabZ family protein [Verrucomicrobiae bacterium]|nr:3-hydroxyacyl-ACP dehydratase FabZ family protein [Verrucomicrobiae bacterium]
MSDPFSQALACLPHGPEFRLVDRLLQLDAGRSGAGEYRVRGDEAFLRGHFPGQPMMPGVLLTEALAQLAGVVAQSDPAIPPLRGLRLTALRNVKILGTAVPGEVLRIEAKVAGRLANLVQASGSIYVADRLILSGDVTLSGEAQ